MYFHAPQNIYGPNLLRILVDEIGGVKVAHKYLGISERTMFKWLATDRAPRAAVLALFWESKYGRSQIFTDQVNEIRILYRKVNVLEEQYQRAKDIITGLRSMHTGSSNEPLFEELPAFTKQTFPTFGDGPDARSILLQPNVKTSVSHRAQQAAMAFERTRAVAK